MENVFGPQESQFLDGSESGDSSEDNDSDSSSSSGSSDDQEGPIPEVESDKLFL